MDNRVTKKRIAIHFEYDWLKYVLVILASIFVWYLVFMQINITREFERFDIFVACYDHNGTLSSDFKSKLESDGDTVIRDVNVNFQSPVNEYYGQLFTSAGFTSDILIIPKSNMEVYADWFLELDDVIDGYVPDELKGELDYYVYSAQGRDEDKVNASSVGKTYGIRIDNLKKINVENPPFVFNPRLVNPDLTDEEAEKYETEFYLVVDRNSVKIGDRGKEEKYRDLTQAYEFVRYFLTQYGL